MHTHFVVRPDPDVLKPVLTPVGEGRSPRRGLVFKQGLVEHWSAPRYRLGPAALTDWLWAVDAIRLVSSRVRDILETHRDPADDIQWLPVEVETDSGDLHPYWMIHFPTHLDVLLKEKTVLGSSGLPIRQVLSSEKLRTHAVVAVPGTLQATIVRADILAALQAAGVTGMSVQRIQID